MSEFAFEIPPLYLSLLSLSPRSRQARTDAGDLYQMHRTLARAFPEKSDTTEEYQNARCLFRLEEQKQGLCVLVQSRLRPDWSFFAQDDYLTGVPEMREWTPAFVPVRRLAFRLRANPTVKREGKRRALRTEEERLNWLRRKGESGGFSLIRAIVKGEDPQRLRKWGAQGDLNAVRFDGVLTVRDTEAFASALASGIGSAKGFGFGLLSVART